MAIMQEEHQLLLEVLTPARAGETQSGRQAALEAKAKTACCLEFVELEVLQSRRHSQVLALTRVLVSFYCYGKNKQTNKQNPDKSNLSKQGFVLGHR